MFPSLFQLFKDWKLLVFKFPRTSALSFGRDPECWAWGWGWVMVFLFLFALSQIITLPCIRFPLRLNSLYYAAETKLRHRSGEILVEVWWGFSWVEPSRDLFDALSINPLSLLLSFNYWADEKLGAGPSHITSFTPQRSPPINFLPPVSCELDCCHVNLFQI